MSGKLKAAVIGVGHLGQHHARVFSELDGVELVAVVDTDGDALKRSVEKTGARGLDDYRELVGKIDAVSIAVPTALHHRIAKAFLEAGTHVLVEKPMTAALDEAEELVELAEPKHVVLQVGHIERFNPAYMAIKKYNVTPKFIEVHRLSPFKFRSADIGVVHDLMIHDIDVILSLVASKPCKVDALGFSVLGRHEDIANARISFADGCVANVTASRVAVKSMRKIRIFSPDCYISLDYSAKKGLVYWKSPALRIDQLGGLVKGKVDITDLAGVDFGDLVKMEPIEIADHEPLAKEIESFVECVKTGRKPVVGGKEALAALRLAEDILASLASHKWFPQQADRENITRQNQE